MISNEIINIAYIIACLFFIIGIKNLGKPATARRGNFQSMIGMAIAAAAVYFESNPDATIVTDKGIADFWHTGFTESGFLWSFVALAIGAAIGAIWAKKVKMTGMPELVALFNGFGGLASALVAISTSLLVIAHFGTTQEGDAQMVETIATGLTIFIGTMCFSGSVIAWAKLAEKMTGRAIVFRGQNIINGLILLAIIGGIVLYVMPNEIINPDMKFIVMIALAGVSLVFGVMFVLPIGGGDMPVVIALLNSISGLAAATSGFILENTALIVSGCLVGASGVILTLIMCKAMNRSISNLLFSGFGAKDTVSSKGPGAEPKAISVEDAYLILESASSVVFIPGYGMAVAQAQHVVRELAAKLEDNGAEVSYCVHPVAGRMPGHMNVLLAEADIPYEQLKSMDDMNPTMPMQDVAIVIGANDVVNPAAETDESSPIYGMPIIKAYEAKTVFVLKRGKGRGYSGVENELFSMPNTLMLYGDAKATISSLGAEFAAE
ncbi:MAG: NAD(P)(+) transhydrogenase (Re/Si-specific) subunit beta [Oscillospiraceae bacterium]|nr:NAD(P)(+) transhydrogenase (Re/Si-specific) subunit beta [Oscillospiraceae bacterium]